MLTSRQVADAPFAAIAITGGCFRRALALFPKYLKRNCHGLFSLWNLE
jgi:hypothetical protein